MTIPYIIIIKHKIWLKMKSLLTTIIKKNKVVEEWNDENKCVKDDLNHDNVEEWNL